LHQRIKVKLHWLQHSGDINENTLNNEGSVARRHFRNKKRDYLEDKINGLPVESSNKFLADLYTNIN
jgi:hypothetical protein